jgi:hypothetical protein
MDKFETLLGLINWRNDAPKERVVEQIEINKGCTAQE